MFLQTIDVWRKQALVECSDNDSSTTSVEVCMSVCVCTCMCVCVCACVVCVRVFMCTRYSLQMLYERGMRSLAETTSVTIDLFRKIAEVSLLPNVSTTVAIVTALSSSHDLVGIRYQPGD